MLIDAITMMLTRAMSAHLHTISDSGRDGAKEQSRTDVDRTHLKWKDRHPVCERLLLFHSEERLRRTYPGETPDASCTASLSCE